MENLGFDREKAIEDELSRGVEFANRLQQLLNDQSTGDYDHTRFSQDLVVEILKSFRNSLSILNCNIGSSDHQEVSQMQVTGDSCPTKFQVAEEGSKNTCTIQDRRKNPRRGRRILLPSWERKTPSWIDDDGHVWRKYGQKGILNAKYQRHYYRCSYKTDQGCKAIKQVQKIEDSPPQYRTTYYGHHTCRNLVKDPETILLDSDITTADDPSTLLISFNTTATSSKQNLNRPFYKQNENTIPYNQSSLLSSANYFLSTDPSSAFDPSVNAAQDALMSSATYAYEFHDHHGNVISNNHMVESTELDDFFQQLNFS
ncbi:putative WRKY transcription factor [Quillaja saponaria]|uniref:WRKY transcription factor n=1 Tax=Quillaja saponaria TaxID=32244 RepID=A0AAD7LXJ2_QUISA|nr:putative WRKY transcription factor [Quillaja saponaria]